MPATTRANRWLALQNRMEAVNAVKYEGTVPVREVLGRFNELVSTKNPKVLAEFVPGDEVLLVGSIAGEIAKGNQEIEAFFVRIFARDTVFSWEWDHIEVSDIGGLDWFFADGRVSLTTGKGRRKSPYRISGILEHQGERWLWRQYHGSEPVKRMSADWPRQYRTSTVPDSTHKY